MFTMVKMELRPVLMQRYVEESRKLRQRLLSNTCKIAASHAYSSISPKCWLARD
jgi:hypothetical protein